MKRALPTAALVLAASLAWPPARAEDSKPGSPGIQDNSFLVEEAYNQEPGVIQHISFYSRSRETGDWVYTFCQEWPLGSQRHQLSFTLPVQAVHVGSAARSGVGDLALNYRLQLLGNGESRLAFSPRLTLLTPTGNDRVGLGTGALGVQVNAPVSLALGQRWVTHWNLGATYTPSARDSAGEKAGATWYNLAQSVIWSASRRVNLLLETSWTRIEIAHDGGHTERRTDLLLSPGLRWSHNFASGLQIVPGLAFPIGVGPSRGRNGILLYLSFEHPLRGPARRAGAEDAKEAASP